MTIPHARPGTPITGRMVLLGMILFFGVVGAVNGIFMYVALDTFPGLTNDNAYMHGLDYNKTLADGERQALLGWRTEAELRDGTVQYVLTEKNGSPLTGAAVFAVAVRPVGAIHRTQLVLHETAPGVYVGDFVPALDGRWMFSFSAKVGDQRFRTDHELIAKP